MVVRLNRAGQRDVPRVADRQHVGREDAPGVDVAVEIDAIVEGLAVHALRQSPPSAKASSAGHASIGIQIAQLGRLLECRAAAVVAATDRERVAPRSRSRQVS